MNDSLKNSKFIFFWLLLLLPFISCHNSQKEVSPTEMDDSNQFAVNPQIVEEQEVKTLKIGEKAPYFRLPGVDGQFYSLDDFKDHKLLVIVFTCNHCPTAQAYEDRIIALAEDYSPKSVQVLAISPNSPLGLLYEELGYSDLGDSYEDMIVRMKDKPFPFPYLYDGDNQKVSLAYGPIATPHSFVFDQKRKLQYVGRLDSSEKPGTANAEDIRLALDQLLNDTPVEQAVTKTFGCSTKWGWKTKMRERVDKEWSEKAVTIEELSVNSIQSLMQNTTDRLRLVNVWATWCGPCRIEFPEFVAIQRMFGARDFEFVSLSTDKLQHKEKALQFLQSVDAAFANYISLSDDQYEVIEAIDPNWAGALPYTALIEPGGNIVWSHQGEVNFHELKRTIVDHPMIGRVY